MFLPSSVESIATRPEWATFSRFFWTVFNSYLTSFQYRLLAMPHQTRLQLGDAFRSKSSYALDNGEPSGLILLADFIADADQSGKLRGLTDSNR
jgi:hypothetical protein